MRTYPLFSGETVNDTITVTLPPTLRNTLEAKCREAWRELNKIDHPNESASPFVPYSTWDRTREGRVHQWLLSRAVYIANSIPGVPVQRYSERVDATEYAAMLSRLQAQRYNTRGRRRQIATRATNAVEYRKYRSWWISKYLAQALGVEFLVPCPYEPYKPDGPTESYIEIGEHFEEWTGHKLPPELWAELRRDEAERLAKLAQGEEQLAA